MAVDDKGHEGGTGEGEGGGEKKEKARRQISIYEPPIHHYGDTI